MDAIGNYILEVIAVSPAILSNGSNALTGVEYANQLFGYVLRMLLGMRIANSFEYPVEAHRRSPNCHFRQYFLSSIGDVSDLLVRIIERAQKVVNI